MTLKIWQPSWRGIPVMEKHSKIHQGTPIVQSHPIRLQSQRESILLFSFHCATWRLMKKMKLLKLLGNLKRFSMTNRFKLASAFFKWPNFCFYALSIGSMSIFYLGLFNWHTRIPIRLALLVPRPIWRPTIVRKISRKKLRQYLDQSSNQTKESLGMRRSLTGLWQTIVSKISSNLVYWSVSTDL